ncbi:fish-egg lectin-like [Oncorhynchus kisutch]|uniref:fish-egg lectin-like n=1 Tax=Oncorhynchus kisutch TaxID=8019 RepID=UPI0012DCD520|nr:fish-egg lectin-like [Oncorhynchus kisutch]
MVKAPWDKVCVQPNCNQTYTVDLQRHHESHCSHPIDPLSPSRQSCLGLSACSGYQESDADRCRTGANGCYEHKSNPLLPGSLKQVDAGGNQFIVGVYMKDTSFCLTSSATVGYKGPSSPLPWTGLPGSVKYSSCGPFGCWAVNKNDDIFLMSLNQDCQNNGWSHIDGNLSMIEVATDGSVFGVTSAGSVYTRDGITASKPEGTGWSHIPMCMIMKHVTYDLGRLWVVSKSGFAMVCPH